VDVNTAGIRWSNATTATQYLAVLDSRERAVVVRLRDHHELAWRSHRQPIFNHYDKNPKYNGCTRRGNSVSYDHELINMTQSAISIQRAARPQVQGVLVEPPSVVAGARRIGGNGHLLVARLDEVLREVEARHLALRRHQRASVSPPARSTHSVFKCHPPPPLHPALCVKVQSRIAVAHLHR
jgi:hypothetical protein